MSSIGLASIFLFAHSAAAQSPSEVPSNEFRVEAAPDLALTAGLLAGALFLDAKKKAWAGDLSCPGDVEADVCAQGSVNPVDRWVIGMHVEKASLLSDVLLVGLLAAPIGVAGLRAAEPSFSSEATRFGSDTLVVAQTYAATYFATNLLKLTARRLRPFNYDPRFLEERKNPDSRVSFPSGHASMAFAAAGTMAVMLDQRYPKNRYAIAGAAAGFGVAGSIAVLRVLGSKHFPTDVLVGGCLGTAIGILVPRAHRGRGLSPAAQTTMFALGGRL